MMTALICEKRGASASERTCPAAVQFTQLHNAQQTRTKDAPPGDTRNLRYRRIREVPVPGLDRCVCVCVCLYRRERSVTLNPLNKKQFKSRSYRINSHRKPPISF